MVSLRPGPLRLAVLVLGIGIVTPAAGAATATLLVTSDSNSGPGSLRAQVAAAANGDTVSIPAGRTVNLTNPITTQDKTVTIRGAGASASAIRGDEGLFDAGPGSGLDLGGLSAGTRTDSQSAPAINVDPTASLRVVDTDLFLNGSEGILNAGTALLERSTVLGAFAFDGLLANAGDLTVRNSTVGDTLSGTAVVSSGTLRLGQSTFVNGRSNGAGNIAVTGGMATFDRTIVTGGAGTSGRQNCFIAPAATVVATGVNLESTTPSQCGLSAARGDLVGVDPDLERLPDGKRLPRATSPVVDAAPGPCDPAEDQRGVSRPQGLACDLGAVERVPDRFLGVPPTLDFGVAEAGDAPTRIVTLRSDGAGAVALGAPVVTGKDAGAFAVAASDCSASLAAGASCTVTMRFAPGAEGARSAQLEVPTDGTGGTRSVALAGTGTVAPPAPATTTTTTAAVPPPPPLPAPVVTAPIGPLPPLVARTCASRRTIAFSLIRRPGLRVTLKGSRALSGTVRRATGRGTIRKLRIRNGKVTIDLRGLPRASYTVRVRVRLRTGRITTLTRTYKTCATR